LANGLYYLVKA